MDNRSDGPRWHDPHQVTGALVLGPSYEWRRAWERRHRELGRSAAGRFARDHGFVLSREDLRAVGVDYAEARRELRAGRWTRIARGFVAPFTLDSTGFGRQREQHALVCAAVLRGRRDCVVAGRSAAILRGIPTLTVPDRPELICWNRESTTGRHGTALVRATPIAREDVLDWFGVPLTRMARTVVDLARVDRREAIVVADAALRESLTDPDALAATVAASAGLPGIATARALVPLACPKAESPLESVTRLAMHDDGFPPPEPQGLAAGFHVDFLWADRRIVLETDGRVKYRAPSDGDDDPLWLEKRREIAIRRAGFTVLRVIWRDVMTDWPATSRWLRAELGIR